MDPSSEVMRRLRAVRDYLPRGQTLTEDVWRVRHRTLGWLLRAHVLVIFGYALLRHQSIVGALAYATVPGAAAALAGTDAKRRRFVSAVTALGLVSCSAVLVTLSGGVIEMHFHFFVMVSLLTMYQDWLPFLIAVVFVLLHHAVIGTLDPRAVYDDGAAIRRPFEWALVHAGFLLAACVASVVAWKMNEEQAFRDALTRLPNRALFTDRVGHALARVGRGEGLVAVLFIDLDGFKDVNDSRGHAAGDQLLCAVGHRLRASVRPGDTVARLGGDEFAILVEDIPGAQYADVVAERVLESLRSPIDVGGSEEHIGASIGVALNTDCDDVESLLRNADVAMYAAKEAGKGGAKMFVEGMHTAIVDRIELGRELYRAADEGELVLYYQPIVSLATNRSPAVEALLRWDHPTRGLLAPSEFIAMAEENGAIVHIGEWVIAQACRQAREWLDQTGVHVTVSVNLSPVQLYRSSVVGSVRRALLAADLQPSALIIEVTESVMVADTDLAAGRLDALKKTGIGLAIDDFGTGYSSLSYLRRLPVDFLKIDKSFIDGVAERPADRALVGAIINLAHTLGLTSIAEGVERPEQVTALRELGCHLAQGYVFARPMPAPEISVLLRDEHPAAWLPR